VIGAFRVIVVPAFTLMVGAPVIVTPNAGGVEETVKEHVAVPPPLVNVMV
jgi:hypothetical protein